MDIIIFSFTEHASHLSLILKHKLSEEYHVPAISYTTKALASLPGLTALDDGLKPTVEKHFNKNNVLIFISACGIAVRSIADFIDKKTKDPCVIVIDEMGNYVISLLSGHIGGGNEYTLKISNLIGATPIISTATDLNGKFAVDVFAKKNNLFLSNMTIAKKISAALLLNHQIGLTVDNSILIQGKIPDEIVLSCDSEKLNEHIRLSFYVSPFFKQNLFNETLYLIPKQVVLGIGCKRNTDCNRLKDYVSDILNQCFISPRAIAAITSIDIKKEEEAIQALASIYDCPFITYDAETLKNVQGTFTSSNFVSSITGVDNVCERSSICYSHADHLILPKTARDGMTIAISLLETRISF